MAPLRTLAVLGLVSTASAFVPARRAALKSTTVSPVTELNSFDNAYDEAVSNWNYQWPKFAEFGWGPSVQAEKWNGRHAMFGWLFIVTTAYAVSHNLIPDADKALDLKQWGVLATISGKNTITNERAVILIANVHFLMVSVCAALCPLPFSDPLLLDPYGDGEGKAYERAVERAKNPFGYMPEFKTGVTEEAEIINGRLAMLGIVALIATSAASGKPMLDVVNEWAGGLIYA